MRARRDPCAQVHGPTLIRRTGRSEEEYGGEASTRCPEVGGLDLVQPRGRQQHAAVVREQADVRLASLSRLIDLDHALTGRCELLGDVVAGNDLLPHATRQLVPTIDSLRTVAACRLEE